MVVLSLTKSEGVGERNLSGNNVELHVDAVEQLSSSLPSIDDDGKVQIIVVASFPGTDRGGRNEDRLALAWSLAWVLAPLDMVTSHGR